ncbi:MAG TPA: hypothetical protein VD788_08475, partial [Candidatus Polarisedimenticolaceae bacterium]|nr:hypothetical protein [Candidatus Polarisedimenticolaceae bacterium]
MTSFRRIPRIERPYSYLVLPCAAVLAAVVSGSVIFPAETVPTDVQIPGTQPAPLDNVPTINTVGNCNCHDFTGTPRPEDPPVFGWTGAMMANSGRDPLFWSTVAIAEQDFLPGGGGVGDLCLHCHSVKGWLEGRSTPTNGSGLDPTVDAEGVMCDFCHLLTDPDMANSIPSAPAGQYVEEQHPPFSAYDEMNGAGYYGGAEYVVNSGGVRLGPYTDHDARHDVVPSPYLRDARYCGTCHDVSNPATGDLAHNHGAMIALTGGSSGVVNGPVAEKAAMNNPPESYGVVERTFSEWSSSAYSQTEVDAVATLPSDVRVPGGAVDRAYHASLQGTCSVGGEICKADTDCGAGEVCGGLSADYSDGTVRRFTCQTCHMSASLAQGAKQGAVRSDLPGHDQTGGSYWIQDAIRWQDAHDTLVFGAGLTTTQDSAMAAAQARAASMLRSAAAIDATQVGNNLRVRVTNLTGHKLLSGYPEGRRMWIHVEWYDGAENEISEAENGAYGPLGVLVTDLDGDSWNVQSILDPSSTKVYEAKPAMDKEWADQLLGLGYPTVMVLEWDRLTHAPRHTLGDLAALPAGGMYHTFHFVLNNAVEEDNRIPPAGFRRDEAERRNALPVPDE